MNIRRTFVTALVVLALALPQLPAQASPQFGYEITYYQWDWQYQAYTVIGQETFYCFSVRPHSWGETEFGVDDCGVIKEVIDFDCDHDSMTSEAWWWTGLVWSKQTVCHG